MDGEKKQCTCCRIEYRLSNFYNDKNRKDGKHPWCKGCCKSRKRASELDKRIVAVIDELSSRNQRIFPLTVQIALGVKIALSLLRQDMARLAKQGKIMRLGPRSGYLSMGAWMARQHVLS